MRTLTILAVVLAFAGCRSPQLAYKAKACSVGNCDVASWHASTSDEIVDSYSIEELVQLGLANNPEIRVMHHRIRSLRHRIPQQLSLPDPVVDTTTHLAPVETAAGRQAFALGVRQKVVNVDRRATRAAIALEEVRAAEAELEKTTLELAEQIRVACYQLLLIGDTIRITQEDFESLAQIEDVIVRQYEVAKSVSQQDVLNVQIEQSKVENQLTDLKQKKRSFQARLARLLDLAPSTSFVLRDSLEDNNRSFDIEEMTDRALASRPELESQLAQVRKDRQKICLANLQHRPNFTVGLNWIATSDSGISPVANGDDAVLLGVGFNLPIYKNRIRSASCEAREANLASKAKLEVIQDQIAEEVFDTITKLESLNATISLLNDDIVPKSTRALELSIEAYATGKTDYSQLISNWRGVLKYRIAAANLQSNRMQLLATLARQVGQLDPIVTDSATDQVARPLLEQEPENGQE